MCFSFLRFYLNQKKTFEINPRHPLIQELQRKVKEDSTSESSMDLARILLDTAKLRGGYFVDDSKEFAGRIERMLRVSVGVPPDAAVSLIVDCCCCLLLLLLFTG